MELSLKVLEELAKYDTPTVCNVIELFNVRPCNTGYMDNRVSSVFPDLPPMVGYASTVSYRSDAPATEDAYSRMDEQISQFADLPGPAVVVVQDLDDPPVAATFGDIMCSTYQAFGSTGLITSGAGRDLGQVRGLNYPVFMGGTICAHAYCHLLQVGKPVRVAGLTVQQGDLLHGDANGVTNIPIDIAAGVADVAGEFVAAEAILLKYVKGDGPLSVKGLGEAKREFAAVISKLKSRV